MTLVAAHVDESVAADVATDPPRSFAHTFVTMWGSQPDDQGILTWTVEPDGDGSRITLFHTGGHGEETAEGSKELLESLRAHLEQPDV